MEVIVFLLISVRRERVKKSSDEISYRDKFNKLSVRALAFDESSGVLVSAGEDASVKGWDVRAFKKDGEPASSPQR